jgi:asparaginyl-tRNA synthetase
MSGDAIEAVEDAIAFAVVAPSTSTPSSSTSSPRRVKTSSIASSTTHNENEIVSIKGWVRTVRRQKTLAFVEVNDGSNMGGIQCVLNFDDVDESTMMGE